MFDGLIEVGSVKHLRQRFENTNASANRTYVCLDNMKKENRAYSYGKNTNGKFSVSLDFKFIAMCLSKT